MIRISSKWFVAGVLFDTSGHVYRCAPILGYMMGWDRHRVFRLARIRHWMAEEV